MKTHTDKTQKAVHFGTISMPIAKGLYKNKNGSLILVLLYVDSRKGKLGDKGYEYPFEYNAPDIHFNTGVGLKVVNRHLRMLEQRGALVPIKTSGGKLIRTGKGAVKYRVHKTVYEQHWGPNSRGANVLDEGRSEPSESTEAREEAGLSTPCADQTPGHSGPGADLEHDGSTRVFSAGQSEPGTESRALGALQDGRESVDSRASSAHHEGLSGTPLSALRPGLSAPTNDNERIREEKSTPKKEDRSGCASASPPLDAPVSAATAPSPEKGSERSKDQGSTAGRGTVGRSSDSGSPTSLSSPSRSVSSSCPSSSSRSSSSSRDKDPIDPHYGIPVSYVKRYQAHADDLNNYIKDNPEVGQSIESGSDAEAGRLIMHLLDVLNLG